MFNDSTQIRIKAYQQRSGSIDSEEIDLTEILNQIPDDYEQQMMHQHQQHIHMPVIPSPNPTNNSNNQSNENVVILAIKLVFAVVFTQLQKLPISSRIIHQIMILHFILSSVGLAEYIVLSPQSIIDRYQYWRFITYPFAGLLISAHSHYISIFIHNVSYQQDTSMFMALVGCATLGDIFKRMVYHFGSIWTFYLFLFNWILISSFTFGIQYLFIKFSILPQILGQYSCIGLYPMIFNLSIIEIILTLPNQIYHFLGMIYMKQAYLPIIYSILFIIIRFDVGVIVSVLYTYLLAYCLSFIFHLSRYTIQKMEKSKLIN